MSIDNEIGKKAEEKIKEWLDHPEQNISYTRLYDQMTGYYMVSRNICDFIIYEYPSIYFLESKATWHDRFDFSMIQPHQKDGMLAKSKIKGSYGLIMVLFATYQKAFIFNIKDIAKLEEKKQMSLNIKKQKDWNIPYCQVPTISNNRKKLLDYKGDLNKLLKESKVKH